ncbi:MAG: hypothetical protein AB1758_19515 [Candidatus Eremiobacterota bacterium]
MKGWIPLWVLVLACLAGPLLAQQPSPVQVVDLIIRNDALVYRPNDEYSPVQRPDVYVSSNLKNTGGSTVNVDVQVTVSDLSGTVLRTTTEKVKVPPGKPTLYWAPPFYNPGRLLVQVDLVVKQGDTVLSGLHKSESGEARPIPGY